ATVHVAIPTTNGSTTYTLSRDVTTDSKGNFTTTFTLPTATHTGSYTATVTGATTGIAAQSHFDVTLKPTVVVKPSNVTPGQAVTVSGGGYSAKAKITITITVPLFGGGQKVLT